MAAVSKEVAPREAISAPELLVAYASEGNLYITDGSAPARLLYDAGADDLGDVDAIHFSDDGALVAFTRAAGNVHHTLWVVSSVGGDARELVGQAHLAAIPTETWDVGEFLVPEGTDLSQVGWVPGSHSIAYTTRPAFDGKGVIPNGDLWRVDADTGEVDAVAPGSLNAFGDGGTAEPVPACALAESLAALPWGHDSALHVAPSPDGSMVAVVERTGAADSNIWQLVLTACDGSRRTVYERACLVQFGGWSPDGASFLFDVHAYECDAAFNRGDIDEPADGESVELYIGRPCADAVGVRPSQYSSAGQWLDADHFLYRTQSTYGGSVKTPSQLRLGNVDGTGILLLEAVGNPVYDFVATGP